MLPKYLGYVSTWTKYRCWRNELRPKPRTIWRATTIPIRQRPSWNDHFRWSVTSYAATSIWNPAKSMTLGWRCLCWGNRRHGIRCWGKCCRKCLTLACNRTRAICVLSMMRTYRVRQQTSTTRTHIRHQRF